MHKLEANWQVVPRPSTVFPYAMPHVSVQITDVYFQTKALKQTHRCLSQILQPTTACTLSYPVMVEAKCVFVHTEEIGHIALSKPLISHDAPTMLCLSGKVEYNSVVYG